jgi:hypothetical protein
MAMGAEEHLEKIGWKVRTNSAQDVILEIKKYSVG